MLVALSPGKEARITLADGTELVARRTTSSAGPSTLAQVTAEQVALCTGRPASEGCFVVGDEGMVSRLRVTTPLATDSDLVHDDVELHVGKGNVARRIRWDVRRPRP